MDGQQESIGKQDSSGNEEMSDKEAGAIAYALLKVKIAEEGICPQKMLKELGKISSATTLRLGSLKRFIAELSVEVIWETIMANTAFVCPLSSKEDERATIRFTALQVFRYMLDEGQLHIEVAPRILGRLAKQTGFSRKKLSEFYQKMAAYHKYI